MAEKISVYVDEKLHRALKAAAMDSVRESLLINNVVVDASVVLS